MLTATTARSIRPAVSASICARLVSQLHDTILYDRANCIFIANYLFISFRERQCQQLKML